MDMDLILGMACVSIVSLSAGYIAGYLHSWNDCGKIFKSLLPAPRGENLGRRKTDRKGM